MSRSRSRLAATLLSLAATVLAVPALAGPDPSAALPPPPVGASGDGRRSIERVMTGWYDSLHKGECLQDEDPGPSLKRLADAIATYPIADEKAAYLDYYERQLVPNLAIRRAGVPGFGTHAEIEARRQAWVDWKTAGAPKPRKATTAPEIRALAKELAEYVRRITDDHAFVVGVMAASACYNKRFEYQSWRAATDERPRTDEVDRVLKGSVPHLGGAQQAKHALARLADPMPEGIAQQGSDIEAGYLAYTKLVEEAPLAAAYAELDAVGAGNPDAARYPALIDEVGAALVARIERVTLAAKTTGSIGPVAGLLKKIPKLRAWHATSALHRTDRTESDTIERDGKTFARSYRLVYDAVGLEVVVDERRDWYPDLPGLPRAKVCTVYAGSALKYKKGLDRKLGSWLLQIEIASPIVCPAR